MKKSVLIPLTISAILSCSLMAKNKDRKPWDSPGWERKYPTWQVKQIKREKRAYEKAQRKEQEKSERLKYAENAKKMVAQKMGVSPESLVNFWDSLNDAFTGEAESEKCFEYLDDNDNARSEFLSCLSEFGRNGLTEKLFAKINDRKLKQMKTLKDNANLQKTVNLSFVLEDLIRYQLEDRGIHASWWVPGEGFLDTNDRYDFKYQNGDVILEIGYSAVSAIITQSTMPQRKFSHALMIKDHGDNQFGTMEALIQTGVISRTKKELLDSNIQTLMVMRVKDEEKRKYVADIAADCGWEHVKNNTDYDLDFDGDDHSKIFCSELVASCYAKGIESYGEMKSNTDLDYKSIYYNFTDHQSSIFSDGAFEFLENFGMKKRTMPSPGDIFTSPYLEVMADYRPTSSKEDDLGMSRLWNVMFWGDLFVQKLDQGYGFEFSVPTKIILKPLIDGINFLADKLFGDEMMFIPTGFNAEKATHLAAMDKFVYAPTTELALENLEYDGYEHQSILETPIWVRVGYFHHAMEANAKTKWILKNQNK